MVRETCFANNLIMRHVGDRMVVSPPLVMHEGGHRRVVRTRGEIARRGLCGGERGGAAENGRVAPAASGAGGAARHVETGVSTIPPEYFGQDERATVARLDILTANDRVGGIPGLLVCGDGDAVGRRSRRPTGDITCDVAVIGGGYTGLVGGAAPGRGRARRGGAGGAPRGLRRLGAQRWAGQPRPADRPGRAREDGRAGAGAGAVGSRRSRA